ncbi:uncharacterized protein M6B38_398540 [Iris pallida]|uniref:Pre-mRNA-processing factor 39 n=1 Tax=Iris pallida TaxID=29817 RepID=A0AAX6FUS1_IRIPA|nr:uncharacterized protein M6B38_398540 [Iris pallida]
MLLEEKIRALVENNQIDFGAWTSLISEIEKTSPNDVRKIRMVYDSFLSEFPLCYGYWNKYASHMANIRSLNDADKVYKRAVGAAEYSVDIWVSYCTFGILAYEDPADIRRLFERALSLVGKDYSCYLLWDKYIEFEYSQKQLNRLVHVYISSLRFPTKKLYSYYESFKNLVAVWEEEMGCDKNSMTPPETVSSEITDANACAEILNLFRDTHQGGLGGSNTAKKYLSLGELFYQKSSQIDKKINCYESCISRPYFHVKPLDDTQLENWHKYLDFVETQGDFDWIVKLYERCLIPCANYSEFWIRYMEFVDAKGGREIANHALQRALTVFCKRVPAFHLYCSMFKEKIGDVIGALAPFHLCGVNQDPEFIGNVIREANIKKRMGNTEAAHAVYERAVEIAKTKQNLQLLCRLYSSFARFTFVVSGSIDAAIEVFVKAIQQVPCKSIIQELINFITLHGGGKQMGKLDSVVTDAISTASEVSQALNSHDREEISNLFLEFVDFYGTIHEIRKAWDRHRKLFPHIMRSYMTWDTDSVNRSSMSMKVSKQNFGPSPHQTCKDSGLDGLSVHLLDSQSLTNANGMLSEGVLVDKLQEDLTDAKGREKLVQDAKVTEEQPVPDVNEIHKAADKQAPECLDAALSLEETPENPKIDSQIKPTPECLDVAQMPEGTLEYPKIDSQSSCPERDGGDDSIPPALGKIPINSPENQTLLSNPDGSHGPNIPQEAESSAGQNKHQDEANSEEVSVTHVSDQGHRNPPTPSQANLQETNSPLHSICDSTPPESGTHPQSQMQSRTNQQHALPVDVACSQPPSTSGNWAQMYYDQSFQPQQWQGHSQMQYAPAGTANQQMAVAQGYPYQSQAWTQQATQTVGQYQMGAGQVYPMGAGQVYPIDDMQQQAYAYSQSQPAAQPQTQLYQQAVLSNEQQYGYVQNGQGIPSHMWQYYQQQWYYLQQQQQQQKSQQVQNNPQLEQKIEQLQPINSQQQQNQKILSQQQPQQEENPQQPSQLEQQQQNLSPLPNQSQYQQQQLPQFHQQTEQLQNAQQHPHLLYMQQQQQQLYLQQQQHLYLHQQQVLQQQQFQQLPPEQQQLLLQQQQQLLIQQQQQQMLQLQQQQQQQLQQLQQQQLQQQQQQQQQQMQQTNLTELKTSSDSANLQQTLSVKKKSGNQKEYSEKAVSSQGDGAKFQKPEQSRSPFSTPSRATPNR